MDENNATQRILPDPSICKARAIGAITGFAQCLVERPMECRYVLYFGEGNICRHPRWREFPAGDIPPEGV
ncbi:MAG TPA: hypothetical protein VG733_02280 [Chthoniobacteraceae bacterium]|nr:hypothetical protein [Chthoniobacteraceae bacterium]